MRQIFDLYETGRWSFGAIAKRMEKEGRLTSTGNNRWDDSRIYTIIMNEKYVGDVLMQKNYSESHITHKEVKNRDRVVPQYYLRDHHEPIITRKQYERCQRIAALKNNHGNPVQYPYGDMLVCPICDHKLRQHVVKGHHSMNGWHCDRDEDSCRRYIVRRKILDGAMLEAINGLDAAELRAEGYTELAAFRRKHWKVKTVDYYWLDEYVEKITFGQGHTLTVHWKCGLETTVKMRVTCKTNDPVKLAEMIMAEGS